MSENDEERYDPASCWTAAELRAVGFPIPATIPDAAWITRSSLRIHPPVVKPGGSEGAMHLTISATFLRPFRWISIELGAEPGG